MCWQDVLNVQGSRGMSTRMSFLLWFATAMGVVTGSVNKAGAAAPVSVHSVSASHANLAMPYGRLPLSFELNEGQTDRRVEYVAHGKGYSLFLTREGAVLALRRVGAGAKGGTGETAEIELKMMGGTGAVELRGEEELAGKSNYFIGQDAREWHTGIPTYGRVRYAGVYGGVDVVYYGRQGELEYDLEVGAGADVGQVRYRVEGAERLRVEEKSGELVVETKGGEVVLRRPEGYQGAGAGKRRVVVRYALKGSKEFGFEVGRYRKDERLTIDPVLSYSTYLGGSGGDVAYAVGVDTAGNAYVAGETNSTNFPTSNARQGASGGNGDAFVAKLNPTGTALLFSTYFGGSGSDSAAGLAVGSGDVFVTGTTTSADFPIAPTSTSTSATQAFQTVYGGNGDAFVAQFGSTGTLVYSSYLGGSGADFGQAVAVDSMGNAYVTGSTQSPDFPTAAALQPTIAGSSDAFVTKVNFSGTALIYSTFLGGSQADTGQGIAVDAAGNAYVAGYTFSADFPTKNALQGSSAGDADAFVTELNPAGSTLVFSTYLGGSGRDRAFGLALDSSANIYVVGDTQSSNFPTTPSVFQTSYGGNGDAFVSKLAAGGTSLAYSTFLGGSLVDQGNGIAVDSSGNAAVV